MVFTRTKHGAKALTRQLNKSGVPTVELHGNLGQGARTRNLDAFQSGKAAALVATDIAARGIHVDDVALVVHADPPAEHKAYLHRSGRTARAGNAGTVVTLMTTEQVRDVRDLTRAAGIKPTTTRIQGSTHPVLLELAPGERKLTAGLEPAAAPSPQTRSGGGGGGGRNRARSRRGPWPRSRPAFERARPPASSLVEAGLTPAAAPSRRTDVVRWQPQRRLVQLRPPLTLGRGSPVSR